MFVCVFPFLWWQRPWNLGQGKPEAAVAISKDLICKFFEKRLQLQWVFRGLGFSLDHCQSVYTFFLALTMPLRVVWKKKVCLVNSVWCGHIEFRARNVFGVGRYICQRVCHISHFFASSLETFTTAASFLMVLRQQSLSSMLYWRWEKIEMDSLWDTVLLEMQENFFSKKWWKQEWKWQKSLMSWKAANFLVFRVEICWQHGKAYFLSYHGAIDDEQIFYDHFFEAVDYINRKASSLSAKVPVPTKINLHWFCRALGW